MSVEIINVPSCETFNGITETYSNFVQSRGVLKTQSRIYDGAFFQKLLKVVDSLVLIKQMHVQMTHRKSLMLK